MSRTTSKVKTVITTAPDGETSSTTTIFGEDGKDVTVSVKTDGEIIGGGGLRANVSDFVWAAVRRWFCAVRVDVWWRAEL